MGRGSIPASPFSSRRAEDRFLKMKDIWKLTSSLSFNEREKDDLSNLRSLREKERLDARRRKKVESLKPTRKKRKVDSFLDLLSDEQRKLAGF